MPDSEYATKGELRESEKRISNLVAENRQKIQENSEYIAELRAMYKTLEDLPNTLNGLDKTIIKISDRMDNMAENLKAMRESINSAMMHNKEQDDKIEQVDSKSKVDWTRAITDNFWKIFIAFGVIYYVVKDLMF